MPHRNGFETVIFDLDGTLRYSCPSPSHTFFDYAVQLGVEDRPENRRQAMRWSHYYWAQSPEFSADRQSHQDDDEAFWMTFASRYLSAYGCSPEQAHQLAPQMHAFMSQEYQPEDWVPPEAFDTLRELKDAGYTLGLVSNRTDPAHEQLGALGLLPYLDFAFVAGEVEIWKPAAGIFHHAVELAGSSPERCVYVGDNYYADVVGAKNAGLTPILLDPEGIFPDAECTVIRSLGDLSGVL